MYNRLMSLYTQVEELLEKMADILPCVDISHVEVNQDYIEDTIETLSELDEYLDYLNELSWENTHDNDTT